jgi:hypothetical protein
MIVPAPPSSLRVLPSIALLAPLLLAACMEDEGRNHRYLNKPPAPVARPASPASAPVAEPAIGSIPSARIMSVRTVATGVPVSLELVREPIEILAMASRGRTVPASRPVRVELVIRGPVDTVLSANVSPEVPLIVALPFHVDIGGPQGLPPGRYEAQARIVGEGSRPMAESVPVSLVVRP